MITTRYAQPVPDQAEGLTDTDRLAIEKAKKLKQAKDGKPGVQGVPGTPGGGAASVTERIVVLAGTMFVERDITIANNYHITLPDGQSTDFYILPYPPGDPLEGKIFRVSLEQGPLGTGLISWAFGGVRTCWPGGGAAPALSVTGGNIDTFEFEIWNKGAGAFIVLAHAVALNMPGS